MKLKSMPKEEIELLSYTDLTYRLLEENKKAMNTAEIFKEICSLLEYTDSEYSNKIGDFYTSLTIDKRFIMLDNAEWDLRERHAVELEMDEDEDEDTENEEETVEEEAEENIDEILDDDDLDDVNDDIEDLAIVSDEELEE